MNASLASKNLRLATAIDGDIHLYTTSQSSAPILTIDVRQQLIIALSVAHLLSFVPLAAVSVYVVRVMYTTSILHLNLRLLFVWHAVATMLFAAAKVYSSALNILFHSAPQFPFSTSLVDGLIARFGLFSNTYVTPVLVVERIMATHAVENYEQRRGGHYFLYTLMALVLLVSAFATLKDINSRVYMQRNVDLTTVVFHVVNILSSVIAYVVLLNVLRYNENLYKEDLIKPGGHSLSKRYQCSENIRANRQILPIVLLHLMQTIPSGIFYFLASAGTITTRLDFVIYSNLFILLTLWLYFATQIAIITRHPILRRDTLAQLQDWPCCRILFYNPRNRVMAIRYNNTTVAMSQPVEVKQCKLRTIDGHELIPRTYDQQAEHFKTLADYWSSHSGK